MEEEQSPKPDHVSQLVLIRHGRTTRNALQHVGRYLASTRELNESGLLPDHLVKLDEVGEKQAWIMGKVLVAEFPALADFDIFFDTGYERSMMTLDFILAAFGLHGDAQGRRRSHLDLREREQGYPHNLTITQTSQFFPWLQEYEAITGGFYSRPPGGESVADVCSRVHMFLNSLRRARQGQRVLAVAHGRIILAFRYWLEKWPAKDADVLFKQGNVANCEVLKYDRVWDDGRWRFRADDDLAARVWGEFMSAASENDVDVRARKPGLRPAPRYEDRAKRVRKRIEELVEWKKRTRPKEK